MVRNYDNLLFDADGTLFDFDKAERYAFEQIMREAGYPFDVSIMSMYHSINKGLWEEFEKGGITLERLKTERFDKLFSNLGTDGDGEAFNRLYMEALGSYAFEMEGAEEICRELSKSYSMYIVTNGISRTQRRRFAESQITQYMSGIFISEEIGCQKPDPKYFDYVASHIDSFDRNRALIIGDSLSSDMKGGNNAGIGTCWYNPQGARPADGIHIDYEIRELSDLINILVVN